MTRLRRAVLPQPALFSSRERPMAECVFVNKPCPLQTGFILFQGFGRGLVSALFRQLPSHSCDEPEAILKILRFDGCQQPTPVKVVILQENPRQRLDQTTIQVSAAQSDKKNLCWIPSYCGPHIGKSWIAQAGQITRDFRFVTSRSIAAVGL